jgi:hypothetical protein
MGCMPFLRTVTVAPAMGSFKGVNDSSRDVSKRLESQLSTNCLARSSLRQQWENSGYDRQQYYAHSVHTEHDKAGDSASAADDVELHEVGGTADAHGRAGDNSDDVALAHEPILQQTLLRNCSKAIDFLDVHNTA